MQNPELEFMIKLGIPEKAAKIYEALLDLGDASVSDIAERSGLHRPDVYRFLPLLEEKNLVSAIEKGKRVIYRPGDPGALESICDEFIVNSSTMLRRLKVKHEAKTLQAHLIHVKGIESISKIYVDAMRLTPSGENYLRYSSGKVVYEGGSVYSTPEYARLRKTKNVGRLVIANSYFAKRKVANDSNREVIELPSDMPLFDDNISKLVYADRVAVVDHDLLEAFVIESPRFAEYEKKIFYYLWKMLKERKERE